MGMARPPSPRADEPCVSPCAWDLLPPSEQVALWKDSGPFSADFLTPSFLSPSLGHFWPPWRQREEAVTNLSGSWEDCCAPEPPTQGRSLPKIPENEWVIIKSIFLARSMCLCGRGHWLGR